MPRAVGDGGGRERCQRQADGRLLDAAVGRRRRPDRDAALFGDSHQYGSTIQTGIGFTGIAVALLGRNSPLGIAFGASIFAFLNEQANRLSSRPTSRDNIVVTQGVVVLAVVIAYEVVRRYRNKLEQRAVAEALRPTSPSTPRRCRHEHRDADTRPRRCARAGSAARWLDDGCSAAGRRARRSAVITGADDSLGRHDAGRLVGDHPDRPGRSRRPLVERAGVVNIGLEGMMILGTLGAGYYGYHSGRGSASWARWRSA